MAKTDPSLERNVMLSYLGTRNFPNEPESNRPWHLGQEIMNHTGIRVFEHQGDVSPFWRPIMVGKDVRLCPVGIAYILDQTNPISVDLQHHHRPGADIPLPSVEREKATGHTYSSTLKPGQLRDHVSGWDSSPESTTKVGHWSCNGGDECRPCASHPFKDASLHVRNSTPHDDNIQFHRSCSDNPLESQCSWPPDDQQSACTRSSLSLAIGPSRKRKYDEYAGEEGALTKAVSGAPDGWVKCSCCLSGWYNINDYIEARGIENAQDTFVNVPSDPEAQNEWNSDSCLDCGLDWESVETMSNVKMEADSGLDLGVNSLTDPAMTCDCVE